MRAKARKMDGVDGEFCTSASMAISLSCYSNWSRANIALLRERYKRANSFLANYIRHDYGPALYWLAFFKNTLNGHELKQKQYLTTDRARQLRRSKRTEACQSV